MGEFSSAWAWILIGIPVFYAGLVLLAEWIESRDSRD
jgi:hypothetical protein